MGSGGRLYNLWKGFTSIFVSDLEKKNPKIAYENAINSLSEKHMRLKSATAGLLRNRTQLEQKLKRTRDDLAQIQAEIETAVQLGDDESALVLIQQEEELQNEFKEAQTDLARAGEDAEVAKTSLRALQEEIEKLKRERTRVLAQIEDASARHQIQNQLDQFSMDDELKALDNVREYASQMRAEVQVHDELKEDSVEGRLAQIRAKTQQSRSQSRLEELKAKYKKKDG